MVIEKNCEICDTIFNGNKNSKYCSDECRIIKRRENDKKYREKNKEKRSEQYKNWINKDDNKDKVALRMKDYNKNYKKEHVDERKIYRKNKKDTDENYKIEQILRSSLHTFFRSKNMKKYSELIGCNLQDFKKWLEKNFSHDMNWNNYGKVWNLDHVFPVSIFDLTNEDEKFLCFNWKNTRPCYSNVNFSRKKNLNYILCHELNLYFFKKNGLNKSFNDINYGISYLPKETRNCLLDLVNY